MHDQLEPSLSDDIQVTLTRSHRSNVLASVSIELQTDVGRISIRDARILRNRSGVAWFSMPTYSVTKGREYEYFATVELSPALHRRVSEKALAELEQWEKQQPGGAR